MHYVGVWRWIWHSFRHPTHEITLVGDDKAGDVLLCDICKIATFDN